MSMLFQSLFWWIRDVMTDTKKSLKNLSNVSILVLVD